MSNPNSKIDSRVNKLLGVGSTPDCFNGVLKNKNYQSFDKQQVQNNVTEGHIEKNAIEGHIEQNAIGVSKQIGMRGEQYNDYAIQTQQADS